MSARTPDQILEQFGRELKAAKPNRRLRFWLAAVLATTVVAVPTAVATRPVWAPQGAVDDRTKPAGAPEPDHVTHPVYIAKGDGWTLAASTCTFKRHTIQVLFLSTPSGGAGRRCEALTPETARGPVAPPAVYVDPDTHVVLLFGSVPRDITRVQVLIHRSERQTAELEDIPLDHTHFVAALPKDARVLNLVGFDERGAQRLHCDTRACEESR